VKRIILFLLLIKTVAFYGQGIVGGIVLDLDSWSSLPHTRISVCESNQKSTMNEKKLILQTMSDFDGYFEFDIPNENLVDITFSFVALISIEIQNINLESPPDLTFLGEIYLPLAGENHNEKILDDVVMTTMENYFFDRFSEGDSIQLCYPDSLNKKTFYVKDEKLAIDYKNFINK